MLHTQKLPQLHVLLVCSPQHRNNSGVVGMHLVASRAEVHVSGTNII